MNTEQARFNMIEQQIRPWEVLDPGVLALLSVVKREDFVPAKYRELAFADVEIPLKSGATRGQTMLAPRVEARMLQEDLASSNSFVLRILGIDGSQAGSSAIMGYAQIKAHAATVFQRNYDELRDNMNRVLGS